MNVGIIDIGSARIKTTIAINSESKSHYIKLKDETHLSSHITKNVIDENYISSNFSEVLENIKLKLVENACERLVIVGSHALRSISNPSIVQNCIEKVLGEMTIIPGWIEGSLFYKRMKDILVNSCICTVDVGGGSVQIAFGDEKDQIYSIPTGTFTLEGKFQKSKDLSTSMELEQMSSFIKENLSSIKKFDAELIVMGSNCMLDFISSSLTRSGILDENIDNSQIMSIQLFQRLYDKIKLLPYNDLSHYYPDNPFFMYGADKALLNILEISNHLSITKVKPTNESVSSSLLSYLEKKPQDLENLGIKVIPFKY